MNNYNIGSSGNLSISCPTKILTLGNKSSTINIGTDTSVNTSINLGLTGRGNTGTNIIFLGSPMTPLYNILPSSGQLGEIITFPRTIGKTGFTSSFISIYTLPYYGRWFISATVGSYVKTIGGSITRVELEIRNNGTGTGVRTLGNIRNDKKTYTTTVSEYCNILNCTGVLNNFTTTTTLGFSIMYYLSGSGGTYETYNLPSDPYIVQAVRLA